MSNAPSLTVEAQFERVDAIFRKAGLNAIQAAAVARVIVAAERDNWPFGPNGCDRARHGRGNGAWLYP